MAEQKQLNINIAPDKQQGVFANLALIAHTPTEFVFDGVRFRFRTAHAGCAASKRGSTSCRNAGSGEEDPRCIR